MNTKFNFTKLDAKTRALMTEEIKLTEESKNLYFSARFNDTGTSGWVGWLTAAAQEHDEHWLAYQLEEAGAMKHLETRAKPTGVIRLHMFLTLQRRQWRRASSTDSTWPLSAVALLKTAK